MKKALLFIFFSVALVFAASATSFSQKPVTGEWDGAFETPGGPRPFKLVLKVDGEKLTGTAKRPSGDVPITGTVKGSDITFAYTINYGGNDLTMTFSGKITGDAMSGTVSFGGNAEEPWSAKRTPEKPKTE
ncbi:MAG: hypothetical protein ABL952_17280 [Pyrinomonadaceae bacterium]